MKHVHKLKTNLAEFCVTTGFTLNSIVWCSNLKSIFSRNNVENKEQSIQLPRKTLQFNLYMKKTKITYW